MTRLPCCEPWSGPDTLRHSRSCPEGPNEKLTPAERKLLREAREAEANARSDRVAEVRTEAPLSLDTWLSHQPGCSCYPCRYVEAHLDG